MAGLGWRDWTAGEQLTDLKMQEYLQDQAVMRFATTAARDTALAGILSEGMVSYVDADNFISVYDGSSWNRVGSANATNSIAGIVYGQTLNNAFARDTIKLGFNSGGTATTTPGGQLGNIAIGNTVGTALSTGHNNIAIGHYSGQLLASGSYNTFLGNQTGYVMNGDNNTTIGFLAGYGWGSTGNNNTAVGASAGGTATFYTYSGSNNTLLGYQASPSGTAVSNEITLGNSSVSTLRCQVTTITALSDERDKTDIEPLQYGLDFVKKLNPVSFTWNMRDGAKVGEPDIGFIAQHLANLEDTYEADRLKLTLRENEDKLEATPGRLIPILVKAIQELSAKVEELEEKLNA